MKRILSAALLGATLMIPVTITPTLRADDHKYHDKDRNDDHVWNNHEDRAYRVWVKENHRHYTNFNKLRDEDRQAYWRWRHSHSDEDLHIRIR